MPCFSFGATIHFSQDVFFEFNNLVMSFFGNDSDHFDFTGNVNTPTYAAALAIEAVAGLVANFTVLAITLYQRNSFKQSSTLFFTSLLLANLIMVIYNLIASITIGSEEWIIGSTHEERSATCAFFAYMSWNSYMTMSMTLAAISFDRFLFIVKPHLHKSFMKPQVALFVTIGIWLLSGVINTTPFYGLGEYGYASFIGLCSSVIDRKGSNIAYLFIHAVIFMSIYVSIFITSLWTFCFTRRFMQSQSEIARNSVYVSKRKRLFGIFGTMLLAYTIALSPTYINSIVGVFCDMPLEVFVIGCIVYNSITIINPVIQSYFRPEIKIAYKTIYTIIKTKIRRQ